MSTLLKLKANRLLNWIENQYMKNGVGSEKLEEAVEACLEQQEMKDFFFPCKAKVKASLTLGLGSGTEQRSWSFSEFIF